jgi:hypothetical protein
LRRFSIQFFRGFEQKIFKNGDGESPLGIENLVKDDFFYNTGENPKFPYLENIFYKKFIFLLKANITCELIEQKSNNSYMLFKTYRIITKKIRNHPNLKKNVENKFSNFFVRNPITMKLIFTQCSGYHVQISRYWHYKKIVNFFLVKRTKAPCSAP